MSGHLYWQEEKTWMKKIMNFVVDRPTSLGRVKLRWKDVINSDLHKKCLSFSLANDRSKWTNVISPVTQQTGLQPTLIGTQMKQPVSLNQDRAFFYASS